MGAKHSAERKSSLQHEASDSQQHHHQHHKHAAKTTSHTVAQIDEADGAHTSEQPAAIKRGGKLRHSATVDSSGTGGSGSQGKPASPQAHRAANRRSSGVRKSTSRSSVGSNAAAAENGSAGQHGDTAAPSAPRRGPIAPPMTPSGMLPSAARKGSKQGAANPLSPNSREIVRSCFEQPHNDIGGRIHMRVYERRIDYREFFESYGRNEAFTTMGSLLSDFLEEAVLNIDNVDEVKRLAFELGAKHVDWRPYGFKPDFWVSVAEAMTTECMYLDAAMHGQTEVLEAWSGFVGVVISAIRDGYYDRLRRERRQSKKQSHAQHHQTSGQGHD